MADAPIIIQPQPTHGYGMQIVLGALAGVLAWWLIETITSARADDADDADAP